MPGQRSTMRAALVQDLAIDDGVLDALRLRHQPPSAAGKIVAHFRTLGRVDPIEIENRDVGRKSRAQLAAIG